MSYSPAAGNILTRPVFPRPDIWADEPDHGMSEAMYARLVNSTANRATHRLSDAAAAFIAEVKSIIEAIDAGRRERLPDLARRWALPQLSDLRADAAGALWAVERLQSFTDGELLQRPNDMPERSEGGGT